MESKFYEAKIHFHISHNAPYFPPKFCITFVFRFSWVLQPSQEKLKTMLNAKFFFLRGGGAIRNIMENMRGVYNNIHSYYRLYSLLQSYLYQKGLVTSVCHRFTIFFVSDWLHCRTLLIKIN